MIILLRAPSLVAIHDPSRSSSSWKSVTNSDTEPTSQSGSYSLMWSGTGGGKRNTLHGRVVFYVPFGIRKMIILLQGSARTLGSNTWIRSGSDGGWATFVGKYDLDWFESPWSEASSGQVDSRWSRGGSKSNTYSRSGAGRRAESKR